MLELYQNIKKYRKLLGLTMEELGNKTNYTKSSICKIEKGLIDLPIPKIEEFAKALGVKPGELMGWDDKDIEVKPYGKDFEFLQLWNGLKKEQKNAILNLLKSYQKV